LAMINWGSIVICLGDNQIQIKPSH